MFHLTTIEYKTYELLQRIFLIPFIRKNFALAGGTSLALQIGHRKSIDLDFFSPQKFDIRELSLILENQVWEYSFERENSRMFFCTINGIKCDFVHEPFNLINPYVIFKNALLYSKEDIAAMKLHTIIGGGKKKDFFDVYSLLKSYSWKEIIEMFKIKYPNQDMGILF